MEESAFLELLLTLVEKKIKSINNLLSVRPKISSIFILKTDENSMVFIQLNVQKFYSFNV